MQICPLFPYFVSDFLCCAYRYRFKYRWDASDKGAHVVKKKNLILVIALILPGDLMSLASPCMNQLLKSCNQCYTFSRLDALASVTALAMGYLPEPTALPFM